MSRRKPHFAPGLQACVLVPLALFFAIWHGARLMGQQNAAATTEPAVVASSTGPTAGSGGGGWTLTAATRLADGSPPRTRAACRPEQYGITERVVLLYEQHIGWPRYYDGQADSGGTFFAGDLNRLKRMIRERLILEGVLAHDGTQLIKAPLICIDIESTPSRFSQLRVVNAPAAASVLEIFDGDAAEAETEWGRACLLWHRVAVNRVKKLCPDARVGFFNAPWAHLRETEPGCFDAFYRDCTAFYPCVYGSDPEYASMRARHARQVAGVRAVVPLIFPGDIELAPLLLACGADTACLWWDGDEGEYRRAAESVTAQALAEWPSEEQRDVEVGP